MAQVFSIAFNSDQNRRTWKTADDVVMGGVSHSRFSISPGKNAVFEGMVSLENNGGFASVSTRLAPGELSLCSGLRCKVLGDGKKYKLYLKSGQSIGDINYQFAFQTRQNQWEVFDMPLKSFLPTYRGRPVKEDKAMDPASIDVAGFMISNRQSGHFRLEIEWIKGYREGVNHD